MKLHEKIRLMRTVKGWSQEETAEKLQMSLNAYGCIERGETCPNLNRLEQIAQAFGIKLEELVSDKNILNVGMDSSSNFNNWYSTPPSEQLIELQNQLEKFQLIIEQQTKEIEYLKQQNLDLREIVNLLKSANNSDETK
ncbi:MAG: helix-turn-helix transcriptional regulator [Pseudomonadota bacterium]|nr:helix-turn-helix transcriptional regulator [Pseudomonadota bacterium]